MDKLSYSLGIGIGHQLLDMGLKDSLKVEDFSAAISDVLAQKKLAISSQDAQKIVNEFFQKLETERTAAMEKKGAKAKEEGEKYLKENATKEGVISLPSGLQYKVLKEGSGKQPKATDKVECHYEGFLIDGTVFDSSVQRGQTATFPLQGVIAGWTEGLQLMKEGAKYRFFIPYTLGYGPQGAGGMIPPYAALIFDVELIKVI
ncbi:MAG: FKBP-type peptidyl-prolyl cis-trans isomerase [Prevotella sp.]|nr:FKBP-type peptidyl-prolyl cis-trans isomerase [Candidatus Equicola faecalis]MDO4819555.1 FKBP-type peptidyl-prolyl cis-trans isomerase [Prevotella sp.]